MKQAIDIAQAKTARKVEAVAIGASAGGIHAVLALLSALPPHFRLPLILILHLPDDRDSRLAEVLRQHVGMPVRQAEDKDWIEPGVLYCAGPGYHLSVERDRSFSLSCEDPVLYSRPSIDLLMESAADAYGPALAAFLLTGANEDGARGLAAVKRAGGMTVVQDPDEAEVATMPLAAIKHSKPDMILPLHEMHALLLNLENPDAS